MLFMKTAGRLESLLILIVVKYVHHAFSAIKKNEKTFELFKEMRKGGSLECHHGPSSTGRGEAVEESKN